MRICQLRGLRKKLKPISLSKSLDLDFGLLDDYGIGLVQNPVWIFKPSIFIYKTLVRGSLKETEESDDETRHVWCTCFIKHNSLALLNPLNTYKQHIFYLSFLLYSKPCN